MSFLMVQRAPITTGTVVVLSPHIRSTLCIIVIIIIVIIIVLIIVILIVITFKSKTAATGKKITNHSSRKTCVQKLKKAGVPRDKIIDVTGHRNILSLNSYEGDDENQARELSNIISGCKQTSDIQQQPDNSSPNKDRLPLPASSSSISFSTINNFTGTVNFCSAFPGFPGLSNMPVPTHQSTEPRRTWERIRASVLSDSEED